MEINKNDVKRYDFLDVAKAIGIYLVIIGHLVMFNWKTFRFIFAFHMPLFFIIAGFIHGGKEQLRFGVFIKKQIKYYLLPLMVVFLIGVLQCLIIPVDGHNIHTLFSVDTITDLYEGHFRFSFFGSSWFLLCMFWAQLMFYGMLKLPVGKRMYINVLVWVILVALAVYSLDIFHFIPTYHRIPFKLDSAFMATVFMGVGYLLSMIYRRVRFAERKWVIRKTVGVILIIIGAPAVYYISCKGNTYVNLCGAIYARPLRYLAGSVLGSLMVIGAGIAFEEVGILRYIGRNTLIIFLSHDLVYIIIIKIVNKIGGYHLEPLRMDLDWKCILISILTLIICTGLVALFNQIKRLINSKKKMATE